MNKTNQEIVDEIRQKENERTVRDLKQKRKKTGLIILLTVLFLCLFTCAFYLFGAIKIYKTFVYYTAYGTWATIILFFIFKWSKQLIKRKTE